MLHTGDFKMDQLPLDGRITDLRAFARLGEAGVDLFMVDSTNAEVPGFTTSEREIAPVLDRVFAQARRRIIVASFASHVHRVQQVLRRRLRRTAARSRSSAARWSATWASPATSATCTCPTASSSTSRRSTTLPDDRVVLMCTGSQGEPMAALSRMANRDHRVTVGPDDTVILASSLIPGNENAVYRVINGLTRLGANVVHQGNARVHVSGHASAGELLYCYNILRPRNVMPVHGEVRHLVANAELAVRTGVPRERVVARRGRRRRRPRRRRGPDRRRGAVRLRLRRRRRASARSPTPTSRTGASSARRASSRSSSWSTPATGKVVAGPEIHARGFAEDDAVFDRIQPQHRRRPDRGGERRRRRHLPAAAGRPARRRPLGQRELPASPDDHSAGRRSLTTLPCVATPARTVTVVCIGGVVADRVVTLHAPPVQGTSNPGAVVSSPGGVARNVAENLGRLGYRPSLVSVIGDDTVGTSLVSSVRAAGVDARGVRTVPSEATAEYLAILAPDGELVLGVAVMADPRRPDRGGRRRGLAGRGLGGARLQPAARGARARADQGTQR